MCLIFHTQYRKYILYKLPVKDTIKLQVSGAIIKAVIKSTVPD